jgi:hypothetical protein
MICNTQIIFDEKESTFLKLLNSFLCSSLKHEQNVLKATFRYDQNLVEHGPEEKT